MDLEARRFKVRHHLQRSWDGSGMIVVSTKDNKNRAIRLGEDVVKSLKAHQERQVEQIASAHGLWKDPELVFIGNDEPLHEQ